MNPRIVLAELGLIAIVSICLIFSADARPTSAKKAQVAPVFDVAAVPAYPTASQTPRADRRAGRTATRSRQADANGNLVVERPQRAANGDTGVIRSRKTGATARVASRHAPAFQAYIDDLEARGAAIYYMGGIRKGPCWIGGLHPCGKALDVCQDARDRVSGLKNCNLPGRAELARIAAAHGLFEGGQWCNGDMGHVQVGATAAPCRKNLYAAVAKFKKQRMAARSGL